MLIQPLPPTLLRGARAIGGHLGISARRAQALHQRGLLPTFREGGTPLATVSALDDWLVLTSPPLSRPTRSDADTPEVDAVAATAYTSQQEVKVSEELIDYESPLYKLSDAARVSNVQLNTLRSYYAREDFRIVKGIRKEGRGVTSLLTLKDVMCIAVACRLIESGCRPAVAFQISMRFAYFEGPHHAASKKTTDKAFIVLIAYPSFVGGEQIVATDGNLAFFDLFSLEDMHGIVPPVLVVLNAVEHRVLSGLGLIEDPAFDPLSMIQSSSDEEREPDGD